MGWLLPHMRRAAHLAIATGTTAIAHARGQVECTMCDDNGPDLILQPNKHLLPADTTHRPTPSGISQLREG